MYCVSVLDTTLVSLSWTQHKKCLEILLTECKHLPSFCLLNCDNKLLVRKYNNQLTLIWIVTTTFKFRKYKTYTDDGFQKHLNLCCLQKGQWSALKGCLMSNYHILLYQLANQVLKPTCISSRVLMAVRKCSLDLLQFTSFCRASELSVNWK